MSSILEQAAGIVGLVILFHANPFAVPKFKPFSCGFCLSFWASVVCSLIRAGEEPIIDGFIRIGITMLLAGIAAHLLLFRSSDD